MTESVMSLGRHTRRKLAGDLDLHVLQFLLDQRLGGQHMLDLGGADPVRQRAEGAMRRGVAVAADDRHARQRPALLGADDMHDPLPDVGDGIVVDAEIARVLVEGGDLDAAFLGHLVGGSRGPRGGHVVDRAPRWSCPARGRSGPPCAALRKPAGW